MRIILVCIVVSGQERNGNENDLYSHRLDGLEAFKIFARTIQNISLAVIEISPILYVGFGHGGNILEMKGK